uniref:Uncharacterized protein n=1 Tax=Arundo donax TaxID=35708 RepID=A0A0A9FD34_ARUDO
MLRLMLSGTHRVCLVEHQDYVTICTCNFY